MFYGLLPIKANNALGGLVVCLVAVVLFALRLGSPLFGGAGRVDPCRADLVGVSDELISRGESMSTEVTEFAKYQLCDGTLLYLDANTQVRLREYKNPDPLASQNTQLDLIQGRVIVDGLADVRTRNMTVKVNGSGCELVHYSWLDKLDVTPFSVAGCQTEIPPYPPAFRTSRFNTFNSVFESSSPFEPTNSSARDFYTWTGLQLEALP